MPFIMTSLWFLLGYVSWEACLPSSDSEYNLLKMFEFIKAVSDSLLGMINAVYHDKPSIFIGATFHEKLVSHHGAVNQADSCLHMRRASSKIVAQRKESHFVGRLVGVKLPKTADHWSVRNRSAVFCLQKLGTYSIWYIYIIFSSRNSSMLNC